MVNGPARILILEDDETLREAIERVLKRQGYRVVAAGRGEEAIERARGERFDLIIADIRMEGVNGLDTIEQTQQLQPDIGSIVVSGFASEEETLRAVDLKVEGYLKKPFSIEKLVKLVESFLARKYAQNQKRTELERIREALLWSVGEQGLLAEKLYPGRVRRAAGLASAMSRHLGFGGDLPRQIYLGVILREVARQEEREPAGALLEGLASLPLLISTATEEEPIECVQLALEVCGGETLPSPESLPETVSPSLKEAYSKAREEGSETEESFLQRKESLSGLLSLARTLEGGSSWDEALAIYHEINSLAPVSAESLRARFGQARIHLARGATGKLESSVKDILQTARQMGPSTHALAEVEAGLLLRRAAHPSASKLMTRACKSAGQVGLGWQETVMKLGLSVLSGEIESEEAESLLISIAHPANRLELTESLIDLSADLIWLGRHAQASKGNDFLRALLTEHPVEFLSPLRTGRCSPEDRAYLIDLVAAMDSIPAPVLEELAQDPDPQLRSRVAKLSPGDRSDKPAVNIRAYTLGPVEILLNEDRLDHRELKTQKTRFLLAWLLYSYPHALSVDLVLEEFWPGPEDNARNNMNTSVSWIRRFLRTEAQELDPVLRVGETLGINPGYSIWHDARVLKASYEAAQKAERAGRVEDALPHYSRVVRLYKGPFWENCFMDWAQEIRNNLELVATRSLGVLVERLQEQRRYSQVLEYAFQWLTLSAHSEEAHEAVLRSLVAMNEHDKAVQHFEQFRERLRADDPHAEPSMSLVKIYHAARYGLDLNPDPLNSLA